MNERWKRIACYIAAFYFTLLIGAIICSAIIPGGKRICRERVPDNSAGYTAATELAGRTEQGLGELAEQLERTGTKAEECTRELRDGITGLGELAENCDRIADAGRGLAEKSGTVEKRILDVMRRLGIGETAEESVDRSSGGRWDPGGN